MKDYLGNELEVNDAVIYCGGHGRNAGASFGRGIITKITDKRVRIKIVESNYQYNIKDGEEIKSPDKLIKLAACIQNMEVDQKDD